MLVVVMVEYYFYRTDLPCQFTLQSVESSQGVFKLSPILADNITAW